VVLIHLRVILKSFKKLTTWAYLKEVVCFDWVVGSVLEFIPLEIFRTILEYLHIKEIVPLDNAILSHSLRPLYLQTLDGMTCPLYSGGMRYLHPHPLMEAAWYLKRNILSNEISLFCCDDQIYVRLIERSRLSFFEPSQFVTAIILIQFSS
jgi:hypothetical protein